MLVQSGIASQLYGQYPVSANNGPFHSQRYPTLQLHFPVTLGAVQSVTLSVASPRMSSKGTAAQRYMVIFDWDDTLFPTTMLYGEPQKKLTASEMHSLGKSVYELLAKYMKEFGAENVFIVTNGSKSWVLDSLKMISQQYKETCDGSDDDYFAAIYNTLISAHSIPILSASDEYKSRYPQQPTLWKTLTLKRVVKHHFGLYSSRSNNIYCIISIGDSEDEFKASFEAKQMISTMNRLNRTNNIVRLHRIKLKPEPTVKVMLSQIALLMKESDVLKAGTGSITIQYDVEKDLKEGPIKDPLRSNV